jgi:hypothetical protein
MKKNMFIKAIVLGIVMSFCLVSLTTAMPIFNKQSPNETQTSRAWYYKPDYPNYAPSGVPDFDQQQNNWQKISAGPNGTIDSIISGDDIYNAAMNLIAPGPNCQLESSASGDDLVEWAFCGPVAVANCLWWYDSQFADPTGFPGDGNDTFALVEDYGAGDDHSENNAPLLIEELASTMGTCTNGTTTVPMMTDGIDDWLIASGLDIAFDLNDYAAPTFSFVENEIERSQDVLLLLGFYEYVVGDKAVDQEQPIFPPYMNDQLQNNTWWDFQSFVPTVERLDAIQVCLVSNGPKCDVEINVYDTFQGTPIATSVMNPGTIAAPTWIQFHFDPTVPLIVGETYYFDVRQVVDGFHYEWFYANIDVIPGDPYPPGQGWMDTMTVDYYGLPFDWTFKTEYYDPPPHVERRDGHFVTCAGVNSQEFMIAISDPAKDVTNTSSINHNDAINVSHDIYNVTSGSPHPDLPVEWWLPGYTSDWDYAVVEHAIVLCYVPDEEPPVLDILRPVNALYFFDQQFIMLPFSMPIALGPLTVEVSAVDNRSEISKVEFFVDDALKDTVSTAPYTWYWQDFGLFIYNLRVVAYDTADPPNYTAVTKAVIKFI